MMEALKFLAVLGAVCAVVWFTYALGDRNGYQRKENEALRDVNASLTFALNKKEEENTLIREQGKQEQVDLIAMHDLLLQIDKKAGSVGYQMKSALNASNLSLCLYPVDVRRLRAEKARDTRALIQSANDSADRARKAN